MPNDRPSSLGLLLSAVLHACLIAVSLDVHQAHVSLAQRFVFCLFFVAAVQLGSRSVLERFRHRGREALAVTTLGLWLVAGFYYFASSLIALGLVEAAYKPLAWKDAQWHGPAAPLTWLGSQAGSWFSRTMGQLLSYAGLLGSVASILVSALLLPDALRALRGEGHRRD